MTKLSSILIAVSALALATPLAAQVPTPPAATEADRRLQSIYEAYSLWTQKEFGYFEDEKGENQPAAYLARVDAATSSGAPSISAPSSPRSRPSRSPGFRRKSGSMRRC